MTDGEGSFDSNRIPITEYELIKNPDLRFAVESIARHFPGAEVMVDGNVVDIVLPDEDQPETLKTS